MQAESTVTVQPLSDDLDTFRFAGNTCRWDGKIVQASPQRGWVEVERRATGGATIRFLPVGGETSVEHEFAAGAHVCRITDCKDGRVYAVVPHEGESWEVRAAAAPDAQVLFWMQSPDVDNDSVCLEEIHKRLIITPEKYAESHKQINGQAARLPAGTDSAELHQFLRAVASVADKSPSKAPRLRQILTPKLLESLLEDEEAVKDLIECMPETQKTHKQLAQALLSPQLGSAIGLLESVVHQGQFPVVCSQLGISKESWKKHSLLPATEFLCRTFEEVFNKDKKPEAQASSAEAPASEIPEKDEVDTAVRKEDEPMAQGAHTENTSKETDSGKRDAQEKDESDLNGSSGHSKETK